ncbi:MAG: hypothetical protein WAN35_03130 [Terracidiphilus sp.]
MNPIIRVVRTMQVAFIASVLLFLYVLHVMHPALHSVNPAMEWSFLLCAIGSALSGFILQRVVMNAPNRPGSATQSSTPRGQWFTGHVIRFATAESIALLGFVLRMMGSSSILVPLLFAMSLLLLLFWQPGPVPTQNESNGFVG